jgi:hypothetical protein
MIFIVGTNFLLLKEAKGGNCLAHKHYNLRLGKKDFKQKNLKIKKDLKRGE